MEKEIDTGRLKKQLDRLSRGNRAFVDDLIRLIWCNIRLPIGHPSRDHTPEDWADIWLATYVDFKVKAYHKGYTTPREQLSERTRTLITDWMNRRTANYDVITGKKLMLDLFNDCQLTALGHVRNRPQQ